MSPTDLDPPAPKQPKTNASPAPPTHDPRAVEKENIAAREMKTVRVVEYDMREFFKSCVDLYATLTGTDPAKYPQVPTPFGPEAIEIESGVGGGGRLGVRALPPKKP